MRLGISEQPESVQTAFFVLLTAFAICLVLFILGVVALQIKSSIPNPNTFEQYSMLRDRQGYGFYVFEKIMREPKHRVARNIALGSLSGCFRSLMAMFAMIVLYGE